MKWDNVPEAPNIQLVGVSRKFISKGQSMTVSKNTIRSQHVSVILFLATKLLHSLSSIYSFRSHSPSSQSNCKCGLMIMNGPYLVAHTLYLLVASSQIKKYLFPLMSSVPPSNFNGDQEDWTEGGRHY